MLLPPLFARPSTPVPVRALHLDLKGLPPTHQHLLDLLPLIAAARYNAILVEWEDAFPWSVDERFRSETAYSADHLRAFHQKARELSLAVIPLVQSLGHMETPLRLPEYAHLREVPDECEGLSPIGDGARQLVERMVDDVVARSGPITHFHLGGDEHFTFGRNPDTRRFIEQHGKAPVYLHHIEPLLDRLIAKQIRPILWHDMMHDWDDASLARLGQKADLMFWSYQGHPDHATSEQFNTKLLARFFRAGVRVWGAGAYKGADGRGDAELPDLSRRTGNALAWADLARRFPLRGVVATGWSRYQTHRVQCEPIDGALDAMIQFAVTIHDGQPAPLEVITQWLKGHEHFAHFEPLRAALARLATAKTAAWQELILLRGQQAGERLDERRRGSGVSRELVRLASKQCADAEAAAEDVRKHLAGKVDELWIDRFLAERLDPLREEVARVTAPARAAGSGLLA